MRLQRVVSNAPGALVFFSTEFTIQVLKRKLAFKRLSENSTTGSSTAYRGKGPDSSETKPLGVYSCPTPELRGSVDRSVRNCLTFFVTALPDFRRKTRGKKTLWLIKRVSIIWVLERSISDEERACLFPSARVVGCLSKMWIGNTG